MQQISFNVSSGLSQMLPTHERGHSFEKFQASVTEYNCCIEGKCQINMQANTLQLPMTHHNSPCVFNIESCQPFRN
jgi:hypothetical protein